MSIALSLPPQAAFAAETAAKATLVLLATAAAAGIVALRGGSAAARHLVWTLGVCGVLALPLLSAALPGWRTPLLTVAAARAPSTFAGDPVIARPATEIRRAETTGAAAEPLPVASSGDVAMSGMAPGTIAVAVYLLGMLAVLGRLAIGRWSVARLAGRGGPMGDGAWAALLHDIAWQMNIRRSVRLLRSAEATMPMTWGVVRPTVLLPAEADAWPEERRRVVLMHELAHVARHDCLTQTLAAAACALYWFHPAAWYAARRLRVERELACDDRVLQAGTRARVYAAHLLEVARAFRPAPLSGPVAVSMARPSQLEGRLLAVLDTVRNRRMLTRPAASAAVAVALALVLPLAAIRLAYAQGVPAGVTFGGPKPWKDSAKVKPARSSDAYPDLASAMRQGGTDVTLAARPGERLTLELPEGVSARVVAWDREQLHVRVDDRGLRVRAVRGPDGPHVTVTGRPRTDGAEPHVRIQAPRSFNVHTEADGGGLEIGALNGTFTGSVTRGGLAFQGTRGTVRMVAHGGGAFISQTHLDGRLEMDGGGALLDRNTGNLDVSGAAATAHGRPGGNLRVDVPGRARSGSDDEEIACAGDGSCTISGHGARTTVSTRQGAQTMTTTVATGRATTVAEGRGTRTSVSTRRGGGQVTTTTVTGRAVAGGPARTATTVTTGGAAAPLYVVNGVVVSGEGQQQRVSTAVGGAAQSTIVTTVATADGGGAVRGRARSGGAATTTVSGTGGATTRDRDGFAYTTGDVAGRIEAVRAMARNAPPEAAASGLGRLAFGEDDARVQRAAVQELARMRTRAATEQLRRIARDHPRAAIRAQAAAAIR